MDERKRMGVSASLTEREKASLVAGERKKEREIIIVSTTC